MGIYLVTCPDGKERVVEAATNKSAVNFCVDGSYKAEILSAPQLLALLNKGHVVENSDDDKVEEVEEASDVAESVPEKDSAETESVPDPNADAAASDVQPEVGSADYAG